jgi:hypothetical protein
MSHKEYATVNDKGKVGMDDIGMKTGLGSEKLKLTRLVEHSGSGAMVVSHSKGARSRYERRSDSKKVSILLVSVAAIIIVSAVALAAFGKEAATRAGTQASPPVASFIVTSAQNASTVNVDGSASTSDTGIVSYAWNWGDSIIQSGPTATASRYYVASSGVWPLGYTITLTVTDTIGQTGVFSKVVSVVNTNLPPSSYTVAGNTYASDGVTPLAGCTLNITDVRAGETLIGIVSDSTGFYSADISPMMQVSGDPLIVNATGPAGQKGSSTGAVDPSQPFVVIDVTLTLTSIPEFTDIAIPIAGMISIFALARVASNRSEEE